MTILPFSTKTRTTRKGSSSRRVAEMKHGQSGKIYTLPSTNERRRQGETSDRMLDISTFLDVLDLMLLEDFPSDLNLDGLDLGQEAKWLNAEYIRYLARIALSGGSIR